MKAFLKSRKFIIYDRPYELNIVGVRSPSTLANSFDDEIHVFYRVDQRRWNYHIYPATTDPGTFWLLKPSSPQGTAILKEGQYRDTYAIGLHRGKYLALTEQLGPVTVMRDYDRNAVLDFSNGTIQSGYFGINIHRAQSQGTTKTVDRYSAGCQVFRDESDFEAFMQLCFQHRDRYGNKFTYTLIDLRALKRTTRRRLLFGAGITTLLAGGATMWILKKEKHKKHRR